MLSHLDRPASGAEIAERLDGWSPESVDARCVRSEAFIPIVDPHGGVIWAADDA